MSDDTLANYGRRDQIRVELRRLRELNAELLAKLKRLVMTNPDSVCFDHVVEQARELIVKAEALK